MRYLKGFTSLVVLAVTLLGAPWLLSVVGAQLVPEMSWARLQVLFTTPDTSGGGLLWLITLVAWVAWGIFAVMTVLEVIAVVTRQRIRITLPGFAGPQRLVAALLIAVIGLVSAGAVTPPPAQADPPRPVAAVAGIHTVPGQVTPGQQPTPPPAGQPSEETTRGSARQLQRVTHVVVEGDTLWGISQTYLGAGGLFPQVAQLNHIQPFDPIAVGQTIVVDVARPGETDAVYTVQSGDTLWDIAGEQLDDPALCQAIADVNGIDVNSHIFAGQRLVLPTAAATPPDTTQPATPTQPAPPAPPGDGPTSPTPTPTPAPSPTPTPTAAGSTPTTAATTAVQVESDAEGQPASQFAAPAAAVASVGLLLAAGLITTVNRRRRRQLRLRQIGQRIPLPEEEAQRLETGLIQDDAVLLTVDALDLVLRRIAAEADVPELTAARVAADRIDLLLAHPVTQAPPGIDVIADGSVWTIHATDLERVIGGQPGTGLAPYPTLVAIGSDDDGAEVLLNMETVGTLNVTSADPVEAEAVLAALTLTLVLAPWSDDLTITLIGDTCPGLVDALDEPRLFNEPTLDGVLTQLEARAAAQREQITTSGRSVGQNRADDVAGDAWIPEVIITGEPLTEHDRTRLAGIVDVLPRVAIAAITTTPGLTDLTYTVTGRRGHLDPMNWDLATHRIPDDIYSQMLNLLETSASTETTTAPWWNQTPHEQTLDQHHTAKEDQTKPGEELPSEELQVETLAPVRPIRRISLGSLTDGIDLTPDAHLTEDNLTHPDNDPVEVVDEVDRHGDQHVGEWTSPVQLHNRVDPTHIEPPKAAGPLLSVLGDITLTGHTGTPTDGKSPATMREVLYYLATHPGRSAAQIGDDLLRTTKLRPVLSSLRHWLGTSPDGEAYLPDAGTYGPGYRLHPAVTTDWHLLTNLITGDPRQLDTHTLIRALHLANGKPFQGSPRTSYRFAECDRIEMVQTITDLAHTLTERATANRDINLARWAAAKGLIVDPGSERILAAKLAAEHAAGDPTEVARIADEITATLRDHTDDLLPETLTTLKAAGCLR